jgi:hypothetical protein
MTDLERVHAEIASAVRARLELPSPGFDHRLLDAVRTPPMKPRREPARRLAVATSVMLAVLVVAGLLWTSPGFRARLRTPAARPPAARPTATPTLAPPSGTGFFYYIVRPPMQPVGSARRSDWSGAPLPAPDPPKGLLGDIMASPDGRYFAAPVGTQEVEFVDSASGAIVATYNGNALDTWADDSRHLCSLDYSAAGFPSGIRTGLLVPESGVQTATVPIVGLPADAGGFLATCSFRNDRALLVAGRGAQPESTVYAVQLSTGRVLFHRDLPAGTVVFTALSADCRYAAASSAQQADPHATGIVTDVVDLDAGTVVAHLDGAVAAFSGDDQRVALSQGSTGAASVVEWRTGRTIWTQAQRVIVAEGVRSLPGEAAMALTVSLRAPQYVVPDLVLVRNDGTSTVVSQTAEVSTLGSVGAAG